jgi:predicted Fe-S protein YdhL (DUF1289 family)
MSDDLIARLRSPEETVFPAGTEIAVCGGTIRTLEPFSMWSSSSDRQEAAAEIERLRARVEVLETALRHYAEDEYNGYNADGACARAALEAKP